jgi:hypothetical protein
MTKEEFKQKIKQYNLETIYTSGSFTEAGYRTFNELESWPDDDKSYGVYYESTRNKWVAYINEHEWSEHRTYSECDNYPILKECDTIDNAYNALFALIQKHNRLKGN